MMNEVQFDVTTRIIFMLQEVPTQVISRFKIFQELIIKILAGEMMIYLYSE